MSELLNEVGAISRSVVGMGNAASQMHELMKTLMNADLRDLHKKAVQAGVPYTEAHHLLLRLHQFREALQKKQSDVEGEIDVIVELMLTLTGEIEQAEAERRRARV